MSQLSRPPQSSQASSLVVCSVCGESHKLIKSTGCLIKHGHDRKGHPACPGSYLPPCDPPTFSQDLDQPTSSAPMPAGSQAGTPVPFSLHPPLGPVLPRIPKGARLRAASELEARLNRVLSSTGDLGAWSNLLDY